MWEQIEALKGPVRDVENAVQWIVAAMTVLVFAEMARDALKRRERNWRETLSNVFVGIPNSLITFTIGAVVAAAGTFAARPFRFGDIPITWWSWVLAFFAVDFAYYWGHRFEHRVRFFWAHHGVHHSSPSFDLSTAIRVAWQDSLFTWIYLVPVVLVGFHPGQAVVVLELGLLYQTWIHTTRIDRMPSWFEFFFNTPSAHRVHHGSNAPYLDRNHGGVLMIWDRLFGTFAEETEEVRFGLTKPIDTINPLRVNFGEYLRIAQDLARARTWSERFLTVFGPPEWSETQSFERTRPDSFWRVVASENVRPAAPVSE